jgi:lysophospholipid acyltransferase (LPLAT)-like uncharacterized protein
MWWIPPLRIFFGCLLGTMRVEERNAGPMSALIDAGRPFVFAFWHGSMAYAWWRMRRHRPASLVSQSKDGQILSEILRGWGYRLIRGSSSKGSAEAMDAMRQAVREGNVLAITPDGPRGPRHALKMGAVRVAQTTGVPLVLCAVGFRSRHVLRSWDAFEIPCPFSRIMVEYSDPILIDPDAEGDALERVRADIEAQFHAMHNRATAAAGC